jgi:hypothetical protein
MIYEKKDIIQDWVHWHLTCDWSKKALNATTAEQNGRMLKNFFAIFFTKSYIICLFYKNKLANLVCI